MANHYEGNGFQLREPKEEFMDQSVYPVHPYIQYCPYEDVSYEQNRIDTSRDSRYVQTTTEYGYSYILVDQISKQPVEAKKTLALGRNGRPKRYRTQFTSDQLFEMERIYTHRKYVDCTYRRKIAEKLNLPEMRVKVWFQNRRMKDKRVSIISSTTNASEDQQLSPSQSLSSDISSPTSHRCQSPVDSNKNESAQEVHDEVAKFLQYRDFTPQEAATVYHPMYETCAPQSIQAAAVEYSLGPITDVNMFGEQIQQCGYVTLPNENQDTVFTVVKIENNQQNTDVRNELNYDNASAYATTNEIDLFSELLYDKELVPIDLPDDISTWQFSPHDGVESADLCSL